jgi:hypothetical protein
VIPHREYDRQDPKVGRMAEDRPAPFAVNLFKAKIEWSISKHALNLCRNDIVFPDVFDIRIVPVKLRLICPQAYK